MVSVKKSHLFYSRRQKKSKKPEYISLFKRSLNFLTELPSNVFTVETEIP